LFGQPLTVDDPSLGRQRRPEVIGQVGQDVREMGGVRVQLARFGQRALAVDQLLRPLAVDASGAAPNRP